MTRLTAARSRRGIALPVAMFGIVVIGVLATGIWVVVDLNARSAVNRESSARVVQIAEAGAAHASTVLLESLDDQDYTSLLVGADGEPGTADDGVLTGFGLTADQEIPAGGIDLGGGTYSVRIVDDPNETDADPLLDSNRRVVAECTASLPDGASARVDVVYGALALPALLVDGGISIESPAKFRGPCGGLHSNDSISISANVTIEGEIRSVRDVTVADGYSIKDPEDHFVPPIEGAKPVEMPTVDLWDTCDGADWILHENGEVQETESGTVTMATETSHQGWQRTSADGDPVVWEMTTNDPPEGTTCVKGNAQIPTNPSKVNSEPREISVFATGGIEVTGNPQIQHAHDDQFVFAAAGDISIGGNLTETTTPEYSGLIYAGAQCSISKNPVLGSQMICADGADPAGAIDYASTNTITGNPRFEFACTGTGVDYRRIVASYPRLGS